MNTYLIFSKETETEVTLVFAIQINHSYVGELLGQMTYPTNNYQKAIEHHMARMAESWIVQITEDIPFVSIINLDSRDRCSGLPASGHQHFDRTPSRDGTKSSRISRTKRNLWVIPKNEIRRADQPSIRILPE